MLLILLLFLFHNCTAIILNSIEPTYIREGDYVEFSCLSNETNANLVWKKTTYYGRNMQERFVVSNERITVEEENSMGLKISKLKIQNIAFGDGLHYICKENSYSVPLIIKIILLSSNIICSNHTNWNVEPVMCKFTYESYNKELLTEWKIGGNVYTSSQTSTSVGGYKWEVRSFTLPQSQYSVQGMYRGDATFNIFSTVSDFYYIFRL